MQHARAGTGGRLRLGIIGSATYALLPRLIPSLRARYPQIALELTEATSSEILEGLLGALGQAARLIVTDPRSQTGKIGMKENNRADRLKMEHCRTAVSGAAASGNDMVVMVDGEQHPLLDGA